MLKAVEFWQAFKERLFDSSLSEKYETLQVVESSSSSNRRYRSVSPAGFEEDNDDPYGEVANQHKKLLFLEEPLARSMYRNLESFFDRKNLIRDSVGGFDGAATSRSQHFSRRSSAQFTQGDFSMESSQRPQSSLDFRSASSMQLTARSLDPPRSQSSMDNNHTSSSSFFGRRKKEQPALSHRAHSAERPEDVRREIQKRFAKINFDEGTTDYDALFTVSEEGGRDLSVEDKASDKTTANQEEHGGHNGNDATPKSKLDHLRYWLLIPKEGGIFWWNRFLR
jgi:hypothetical protein